MDKVVFKIIPKLKRNQWGKEWIYNSYRFLEEEDLTSELVFAENDEPSLVNLGIPVDTDVTLTHPNTNEIIHKIVEDCPEKYYYTPLAKILRNKKNNKKEEKEVVIKLIDFKLIPIPRDSINTSFPFKNSTFPPMPKPNAIKIEIPENVREARQKFQKVISLDEVSKVKFEKKNEMDLLNEIKDFKNYLYAWSPKTLPQLFNDLCIYGSLMIKILLNPQLKKKSLREEEFREIVTWRLFFMGKIRKFFNFGSIKSINGLIDSLWWIVTNDWNIKYTQESFQVFPDVRKFIKQSALDPREIENLSVIIKELYIDGSNTRDIQERINNHSLNKLVKDYK